MGVNQCREKPDRGRGVDRSGGRSTAADGKPAVAVPRVPMPDTRPEKSEVNLCDGHRGLGTSNAFRKRDPGRQSAKDTEHKGGHYVRPG